MVKKKRNRPTIAFLTDWSEQDYQTNLREGVIDAAEENDANLFCFVGGGLNSVNAYEIQRNVIYELVNENNVDGVIIMSASIGHYISYNEIVEFCNNYRNMPIVSIAVQIDGIPSVLVDQEAGMRALLTHLIEDHGYTKIAFITGPEKNPEAIQRYSIYREMLNKYSIDFNPLLVTNGSFITLSGINAVKTLFDERNADVDVIVAANDVMALGALAELQERKIYVPGKLAVVGFDNVEEGKYYSPPLTTVHQPFYEQGKKALEILLSQINGMKIPEEVYMKTSLKIRESCGCLPERVLTAAVGKINIIERNFKEAYLAHKDEIVDKIKNAIDDSIIINDSILKSIWPFKLLDSFYLELIKNKKGKFVKTLNSIIYRTMNLNSNVSIWHKVLSEFRCQTIPCISDRALLANAEDIWHQARIMISDIAQRIVTLRGFSLKNEELTMRTLSMQLNTKIGIDELLNVVAERLPKIGIESAFISLYNDVKIPGQSSKLILAFSEDGRIELDKGGTVFPSRDIVPGGILPYKKRFIYIVESFFYAQHQLGFGLFQLGPKSGVIYESIRENISSSLRGSLLLKQVQDQAHCLEEQVKERTRDLIKTNEKLQQEIMEKKKAEEALIRSNEALQQFAYIASHDLQEPLRMIAGYVGLLERRYRDKLDHNANEFIEFVVDGAKRMQRMINDLLLFSRVDTKAKSFERTEGAAIVEQVLINLQATIEETNAEITSDILPVIYVDSSQIAQVFQNLISNAIKFHGEKPPKVHISAVEKEKEWIFSISDNGIGIEKEFMSKIFIMFRRLHGRGEYPGSGIGLTICKRIIERHGGQIWVESFPDRGSTFYFTIPKRGETNNGT
ncbi:MAG: substrate-binding domain-containing protein [Spirochaetales bacterium]|nr:substrate-binding domain-containing protein [Spirochaetales bacterium]